MSRERRLGSARRSFGAASGARDETRFVEDVHEEAVLATARTLIGRDRAQVAADRPGDRVREIHRLRDRGFPFDQLRSQQARRGLFHQLRDAGHRQVVVCVHGQHRGRNARECDSDGPISPGIYLPDSV